MRNRHWNIQEDEHWFEQLILPPKLKATLTREADEAREQKLKAADEADAAAQREAEANARRKEAALAWENQKPLVIGSPRLKGEGPRVTLIDPALLVQIAERARHLGVPDKHRKEWNSKTIEHVAARGAERVVHCRPDWQPALDALREAHANFAPVLDMIEDELTLTVDQPIALQPMLLDGPPGVGKTFFAQNLAAFFQTGFERVSMETAQTASELTGTSAHWSNAAPGRLFNRLIDHDYANPVFLLDEVDKAGGYEGHRADKPLYALLERESAKHWSDTSFPNLTLDTSHVIWLLTSNDASLIPSPLLSRMQRFDIQPMSPDEARQLVRMLYRQAVEQFPTFKVSPELSVAHCDALRQFSPRVVVRLVRRLIARLARRKHSELEQLDLEAVGALGYPHRKNGKVAVGFVAPGFRASAPSGLPQDDAS